jgi:TPR repeat protein
MDELKRLLRRLDGLDGSKDPAKGTQTEAEQHGYVGALRGAPQHGDGASAPLNSLPAQKKTSSSAVLAAAVAAAAISTITVYLVMSWQGNPTNQGAGPASSSQPVVPSKLDFKPNMPDGSGGRQSDTADTLVRRAELLLQSGQIEMARTLLQQAAEMGSGDAALKLGRSYDPTQATSLRYADSQTNPDLAKAWYERALALGTREAAGYISDPGAR